MKNLVMISRECSLDLPKKQLMEMYEDATKDKMGFVMFDLDGDKEKRYRKNFDAYYDLSDEKS
jgi:hypothetical protein